MLQITIPIAEDYDEEKEQFVASECLSLDLEHSLVSLSKWESKWEVPFLGYTEKTDEQTIDYIRMMILGEIPPEEILSKLTPGNIKEIDTYINAKMTATSFREQANQRSSREVVTAELIYYWMISLGIPFECQYWHLARLIALIRVCNDKNGPKKKMSQSEVRASQAALNAQRRKQYNTTG